MSKRKKRFRFYCSLGLGAFILIIILGLFLTQTSYFLNFLRETMISQANKQINGSIYIANLEGNIFSNLTLEDITLYAEASEAPTSEIVSLKELNLNYSFRQIFNKKIIVSSILISSLKIKLNQDDQGIWNLTKIPLPKEASKSDETEEEKTSSSWQINLESLILENSSVSISGENLPEQTPEEITIKQIVTQANFGPGLDVHLKKADFSIQPHDIQLSLIDLRANDKLDISLKELMLSSPKSQFSLSGNFINQPTRKANVSFQAHPLDFSELQRWIPSFPLQGDPNLTGQVAIEGNSISSKLAVHLQDQDLVLDAHLPNLHNPLTANLNLDWKNINLKSWKEELPVSLLKGNLLAQIEGHTWPDVETQLTLKLEDSSYNTYEIYTLLLESQGSPAHLKNTLQVKSEFGEITTKADLDSLLGEINYALSGYLKDLDLLKIIPDFPYPTQINSRFELVGKGIDPDQVDMSGNINFAGSSFAHKIVNKFNLVASYQQGNYKLTEMAINYDGLNITALGHGYIHGNHNLDYSLKLDSIPHILQEFSPDLSLEELTLTGSLRGKTDDLTSNIVINVQNVKFQDYQLASLRGISEVNLKDNQPDLLFTGSLNKLDFQPLPIDSIWINSHYTPEKIFLDLNVVQSDTLDLGLTGNIFLSQEKANLSKLEINALGQKWKNLTDSVKIDFNPINLVLSDLKIASDKQVLTTSFSLKNQEDYDFHLKFDAMDLWPLRLLNPQLETIEGKLSLDVSGNGTLANPQLSVLWNVDKFSLQDIPIHKIAGNIDYQDNIAQLDLEVNRVKEESLSLQGFLPFRANLATKDFEVLKDDPLNLELKVSPFNLSNLNDYSSEVKEIGGSLLLSAKVDNTFNNPQLDAQLLVKDVAFKLPTLGIDYKDINLDFVAHNNRLELKQFSLPSGKDGYLRANGSTVINLQNNHLDSLQFNIKAKDWQALKNRDMDLKISSDLQITGNTTNPTFSGYLNILRARIYLPALLAKDKKKVELSPPLLLANTSTNDLSESNETQATKQPSQTMKNLRGKLKVSFPNNIWISSKEMNIELGGELEVIKNSPDFSLAGNVEVIRGNYTLYGRRFNIVSGNVYFRGESDINPGINIVADYIMRSASQEKMTLSIKITGQLQQPSIQFLLDDEEISEGDGISYIVFGKSTAQLSSGERGQIDSSGEDNLATKILVSQIASRVTNLIQNRLNLDVVEFRGDSNLRQAQVVVGKYLTNNLFLSYEKELSFGHNNDVTPEKITLEYEIIPRLFLQGTQGGDNATGLDLIWKYQK